MHLVEMGLQHFRNYDSLRIKFFPEINILVGQNAQGKTNILEAVFLSCLGKSFRTKKEAELIQWNYDFFYLKSCFESADFSYQCELGVGKKQKKIKINGAEVKGSEFFGRVPVVVFSPEDLQLIKGGPQIRRDFIDLYLAQIDSNYREVYLTFYKTLHHRNCFLKERWLNPTEWEVWDDQLIENGIKIIKYRAALIERIKPYIIKAYQQISGATEKVKIDYLCMNKYLNPGQDEQVLRNLFREDLHKAKSMELERKISLVGPHRDDLALTINDDVELRAFGSQGQQRTAALALKLGLIEVIKEARETIPLLLLDDVMSEFDDLRKQALLKILINSCQTFITATSRQDFPNFNKKAAFFTVTKGAVKSGY
jgi:DNA replication and repair protein RecF